MLAALPSAPGSRMAALKPAFIKRPLRAFCYACPRIALVRLGKWQKLLKERAPMRNGIPLIIDDFAKGRAHVAHMNLTAARNASATWKANL